MKTITSQPLPSHNFSHYMEKARVKTSPSTMELQQKIPHNPDDATLSFIFNEYPFLNTPHSSVTSLKTIVGFQLGSEALQQLVSVNHPNIISIRKIVKTNPKESHQPNYGQTSYTFHY
jgi:hypothetical protein